MKYIYIYIYMQTRKRAKDVSIFAVFDYPRIDPRVICHLKWKQDQDQSNDYIAIR